MEFEEEFSVGKNLRQNLVWEKKEKKREISGSGLTVAGEKIIIYEND